MESSQKIELAREYMQAFHQNDFSGHDIAHVERVVSLANYIAKEEHNENQMIIILAAMLHDTIDSKLTDYETSLYKLKKFLQRIDINQDDIKHILHIIEHMSFKSGKNNHVVLSEEGQIVRDADRLDAIGAIGIARAFQYAGYFKEPMWTEKIDGYPTNEEDIRKLSPSAIRHFYDKLLILKDLMHTTTAQAIAKERHAFMEQFLNQFFNEWHHLNIKK